MQAYRLIHHPSQRPVSVSGVEARVDVSDRNWLQLHWRIEGSGGLVVPAPAGRKRADGLWQTTCFEMFLKPLGEAGYIEFNFSPSERWNAYKFDSYREGMKEWTVTGAPVCTMRRGTAFSIFDAAIPLSAMPHLPCQIGLSAVIEEAGGTMTYWAITHADQDHPDFHDATCFAATLDPPT